MIFSLGQFNQWVSEQVTSSGAVQLWPGMPVSEPLIEAPQVRVQKYDAAVAFLKEVAAGQALVESTDSPSGDNQQVEEFSGAFRVFHRDGLSEW